MGRPKKQPGQEATRERLLRAAEAEFAGKGFSSARLEDIAAQVGVTRASLLHHFPSKERLYDAVVESVFSRLREALIGGMASGESFDERLTATVQGFSRHLQEDPTPARIVVRELMDARGPGLRLLEEQVVPLLELVEAFVRHHGRDQVPEGLDVRSAILDVVGAAVFFAVAGPARELLWGARGAEERASHLANLARGLLSSNPRRSVS